MATYSEVTAFLINAGVDPRLITSVGTTDPQHLLSVLSHNGVPSSTIKSTVERFGLKMPEQANPDAFNPHPLYPEQIADPNAFNPDLSGDATMVKNLQKFLKGAGHDPGPIDGVFGPRTLAALNKWQESAGLPKSATFDAVAQSQIDSAVRRLVEAEQKAPQPPPAPAVPRITPGPSAIARTAPAAPAQVAPPQITVKPRTEWTDDEIKAEIRRTYGYLAGFIDHPEIGPILIEAARGGWDQARLLGKLSQTTWWKTTSESAREWEALKNLDEAEANRRILRVADIAINHARQLGLRGLTEQEVWDLGEKANRLGWSDAEVIQRVTDFAEWFPGAHDRGASIAAELRRIDTDYLVGTSDQTLNKWVNDILDGRVSTDEYRQYAIEQAGSLFPHLADVLARGVTVRQYVDPYAEDAARLLGVNKDDIDWLDPKWNKAVSQIDPKTGERGAMSRADWQVELRSNPIYGYANTVGAKDQAAELTTMLLQELGQVAL